MEQKQFQITVTENQLKLIRIACEEYLRTRMGQFFDYATDISEAGKDIANMSPVDFDDMIARRNAAQMLMSSAFHLVQPLIQNKTEQMLVAEDIYDVIKHELWKMRPDRDELGWSVDSHPPLHLSDEPLIKIEQISDKQ